MPSLPIRYTRSRPIGTVTASSIASLSNLDLLWIHREWVNFEGGPEDCEHNVIMERTTLSGVRIWVVDRDGPNVPPTLMLPEDY